MTQPTLRFFSDYAYAAAGEAGLHVVDVGNSSRPLLVHTAATPGRADADAVEGDLVYVLHQENGLTKYAIERTEHRLVEMARFATPHLAVAVAVADGIAYVTDRSGGLFLLTE